MGPYNNPVLMSHAKHPQNAYIPSKYSLEAWRLNAPCGDATHIYLDIADNRIIEVGTLTNGAASHNSDSEVAATIRAMEGGRSLSDGCIISVASGSMMSVAIKDKSLTEVARLTKAMIRLAHWGLRDAALPLEILTGLGEIHLLSGRYPCVLGPWRALWESLAISLDNFVEQQNEEMLRRLFGSRGHYDDDKLRRDYGVGG